MFPKRTLLYHRGVDDHVGTYVTDYVFSAITLLLCVQLICRIRREWKKMSDDDKLTSQCEKASNWYPWNWPKPGNTPITMTTYALTLLGLSNIFMTLLGGLTHQFLQTVEPYENIDDLWHWLIIWRTGASFAAFSCLGLLTMAEQLLAQEEVIRLSRRSRVAYYVILIVFTLSFFAYNYIPLTGTEDPFSIGPSFIVFFIVMLIYAISTTVVLLRACCCVKRKSYSTREDVQYSPPSSNSISHRHPDNRHYKSEFYTCCKTVVIRCHDSSETSDSESTTPWDLLVTFLAPWVFVSAGVLNHFLKSKCADSDDAFGELGCPLPNGFNHNAAMHVIQIISLILFFIGENMAITRRSRAGNETIRRIITSSTMRTDVTDSYEVIYAESEEENKRESSQVLLKNEGLNNNNVTNRHDDVITNVKSCEDTSECHHNKHLVAQSESDVDSGIDDLQKIGGEPLFPTYDYDVTPDDARRSMYDNLSHAV